MKQISRYSATAAIAIVLSLVAGPSFAQQGVVPSPHSASSDQAGSVRSAAAKSVSSYGKFKTKTVSGYGDDVIKLPKNAKAGIVRAQHWGESNFIVSTTKANGNSSELLVNEIGNYKGTTAFGLSSYDRGRGKYLEIEADGKWTITIKSVSKAPKLPKSGHGDGVFLQNKKSLQRLVFRHDGESNFIVTYYRHTSRFDYDLLINEIGSYKGKKILKPGPGIIVIEADGNWSIRKK